MNLLLRARSVSGTHGLSPTPSILWLLLPGGFNCESCHRTDGQSYQWTSDQKTGSATRNCTYNDQFPASRLD
jgi:hypothetical protein